MILKKNLFNGFTIFIIVVSVLIFIFDNVNGKFFLNDFKVYYLAAKSLVSGDKVYGIAFGLSSGFYKYSPLILLFFIPFSVIPYYISSVIFYFLIVFSIIILFGMLRTLLNTYVFEIKPRHENIIYYLAYIAVLNQIYRDLHMGNTNIILLTLLIFSLLHLLKSRPFYSGILLCIAVLFKPFFLILVLPVILFRKWKALVYGIISAIFLFLIFMVIFGSGYTLSLHQDWISAMLGHSSSFPSENTISSIMKLYTGIDFPGILPYAIIGVTALLYIVFIFVSSKKMQGTNLEGKPLGLNLIFGWITLLAVLPNIVNTDTEHFLYSLPLIVLITFYLVITKDWPLRIIFFILVIMHDLNSSDIVGKYLSDRMSYYGVLGVSNIMIVILSIYIYLKKFSQSAATPSRTKH